MATAIYKMPNRGYRTVKLNNTPEQLQSLVGKDLLAVKIAKNLYLIKDEYANINNKAFNEYVEVVRDNGVIEGFMMFGSFLIVKTDFVKGEFVDISGYEADLALDMINGNKQYYARREVSCIC